MASEPAFPTTIAYHPLLETMAYGEGGMTLRDYFAAAALPKGASNDWRNITCAHPSGFGEELLARMPLWGDRRMRGNNASPRPTETAANV